MELNPVAISDGAMMGVSASRVSEEIVADSTEPVPRGHVFDAVVG